MIYEIDAKIPRKKCPHNRQKDKCRDCGGVGICEHGKRKGRCVPCKGSQICQHDKDKSQCRECHGSAFCPHEKIKSRCRICKPSSFCPHDKFKSDCRDCKGSSFCPHDNFKTNCRQCNGSAFCEHDKLKTRCRDCCGSAFCPHNKRKTNCPQCYPFLHLAHLQRTNLKRVMKLSNLEKTKPSIEYLGCSAEYFKDYLQSKMVDGMTFENIHLDHIKPVSKFDLSNIDALLDCCHYSNFQPLLAKENLEKGNTWNETDEIFWNENIKGKEYIPLLSMYSKD